jgi:hypothetical protein
MRCPFCLKKGPQPVSQSGGNLAVHRRSGTFRRRALMQGAKIMPDTPSALASDLLTTST